MTDLATLNKVQYGGLDFNTLSDELLGRLQIQFASDFNDFALSSMGIMLLDVVAFGLDSLAFYLDRRATDNFLSTARTRKSVAKLTRQLGYKMRGAAASACTLNVSLPAGPYAFNVPIPKGYKFKGPDDLVFEAAEVVTFPAAWPANQALSVPIYQGETLSETFTSTGEKNQVFELRKVTDNNFVVSGTVTVLVNGASWVEKDFLEYDTTDQFEIGYNDSPVTLRFGDGAAGNVPVSGAAITVSYVACRGKAGRVAANTITTAVTPLTVSFTSVGLTINNIGPAVGGDDPEDIEHAKSFAGRVFKSRQVAITQEDYQSLSGAFADPLFGRIAVAQAFSARSAATDLALRGYLDTIRTSTTAYADDVVAAAASLETGFVNLIATLSTTATGNLNLLTNLTNVAAQTTAANTSNTSGKTTAKVVKEKIADITQSTASATTLITAAKAQIAAVPKTGVDALSEATKATLANALDRALAAVALASTTAAVANTNIDATVTACDAVGIALGVIGLNLITADTHLFKAAANRTALLTEIGTDPLSTTVGLYSHSNMVQTRVTTAVKTEVANAITDVESHFSKLLSSDCKANVVTVPILSKNAAGYYAAPSFSLMAALQKYLDARKEVTHTVFVVSGSAYLVRPKIKVLFGLKPSFSSLVVSASIAAAIDALLKDRDFGAPLYNSDLVDVIQVLPGVAYTNVTLLGYTRDGSLALLTDKLDNGNLVVLNSEVITKAGDDASSPQITIEVDS